MQPFPAICLLFHSRVGFQKHGFHLAVFIYHNSQFAVKTVCIPRIFLLIVFYPFSKVNI